MKKRFFSVVLTFTIFSSQFLIAQWTQVDNLPSSWNIGWAIDASDSSTVVFSGGAYKVYLTKNGGENWEDISPSSDEEIIDISIIDSNHIWAVSGSGKVLATNDGGNNWTIQFEDTTLTKFMNYIEMFDLENGVAMGDAPSDSTNALFLSTNDGGNNWNILENKNHTVFGSGDTWRRLDFVSPNIGYFSENFYQKDNPGIKKTVDSGNTWDVMVPEVNVDIIKFYNENIGLAAYQKHLGDSQFQKLVLLTKNGGSTWEENELSSFGWGNDIEFLPNNPSIVWFVDGHGHHIFYSNDTGKTWISQAVSVTDLVGRDIVFTDENNGWILCGDGILLHTNNNGGMITNIAKEEPNVLSLDFKLEQNYPNPFNPITTIRYSVPTFETNREVPLLIKVFNILGKEIVTLVNEVKPSGNYSVEFNAENLPSGIYYYQLKTDNLVQTKKMILLK